MVAASSAVELVRSSSIGVPCLRSSKPRRCLPFLDIDRSDQAVSERSAIVNGTSFSYDGRAHNRPASKSIFLDQTSVCGSRTLPNTGHQQLTKCHPESRRRG